MLLENLLKKKEVSDVHLLLWCGFFVVAAVNDDGAGVWFRFFLLARKNVEHNLENAAAKPNNKKTAALNQTETELMWLLLFSLFFVGVFCCIFIYIFKSRAKNFFLA